MSTLLDDADEIILKQSLVRHYLDTGDPLEELDIALDQAQGSIPTNGEPSTKALIIYIER